MLYIKISDKTEEFFKLESIAQKAQIHYKIFTGGEGFSESGFFIPSQRNEEFFRLWEEVR